MQKGIFNICLPAVVAVMGGLLAPAGAAESGTITALNDNSPLRSFLAYRTPVVITKNGEIKAPMDPAVKEPARVEDFQSPLTEAIRSGTACTSGSGMAAKGSR
jgi:hypothetical protein